MLRNEDGQEVFDAILGRDLVQQAECFVPIAVLKAVERLFVRDNMDIAQEIARARLGWKQLAYHQRLIHAGGEHASDPANAGDRAWDFLADSFGGGFIDQDLCMQLLGHAFESRSEIHDRTKDRHLDLINRPDATGDGFACGDSDSRSKASQRVR